MRSRHTTDQIITEIKSSNRNINVDVVLRLMRVTEYIYRPDGQLASPDANKLPAVPHIASKCVKSTMKLHYGITFLLGWEYIIYED